MITVRLFITAVLLQTAVLSFAQTKEDFYQSINKFETNYVSIFKDNKIPKKEDFLVNATINNVHKFIYSDKKVITNNKIEGFYYIAYDNRLYMYKDGVIQRQLNNDNLSKYLFENKSSIKIGVFTDYIYYTGIEFRPVIIDEKNNSITDSKEKYNNISAYINKVYGSVENYKEKFNNEITRKNLKGNDIQNNIRNNYKKFEYNCPHDTTLVLKIFIKQVRTAVGEITTEQEEKLIERIKIKINPFEFIYKQYKNDSTKFKELISKSKEDNKVAKNKIIKFIGNYDFYIYDTNITDDLLTILTNEQFQKYKKYIDVRFPVIDVNDIFRSQRYEYGSEILQKEKIISATNYKNYEDYAQKILTECGCPFDKTIKRETLIR